MQGTQEKYFQDQILNIKIMKNPRIFEKLEK